MLKSFTLRFNKHIQKIWRKSHLMFSQIAHKFYCSFMCADGETARKTWWQSQSLSWNIDINAQHMFGYFWWVKWHRQNIYLKYHKNINYMKCMRVHALLCIASSVTFCWRFYLAFLCCSTDVRGRFKATKIKTWTTSTILDVFNDIVCGFWLRNYNKLYLWVCDPTANAWR